MAEDDSWHAKKGGPDGSRPSLFSTAIGQLIVGMKKPWTIVITSARSRGSSNASCAASMPKLAFASAVATLAEAVPRSVPQSHDVRFVRSALVQHGF